MASMFERKPGCNCNPQKTVRTCFACEARQCKICEMRSMVFDHPESTIKLIWFCSTCWGDQAYEITAAVHSFNKAVHDAFETMEIRLKALAKEARYA